MVCRCWSGDSFVRILAASQSSGVLVSSRAVGDVQRRLVTYTVAWPAPCYLGGTKARHARHQNRSRARTHHEGKNGHYRKSSRLGTQGELRKFVFNGLYVRALFPGRAHDAHLLQEVKITKPRWKAKFGLNVGTIRSSILQVLGKPRTRKSPTSSSIFIQWE